MQKLPVGGKFEFEGYNFTITSKGPIYKSTPVPSFFHAVSDCGTKIIYAQY